MRDLDPRLKAYQIQAVQFLWERGRAGLFLEMGLGKTASVLQALTPEHLPALVVAPKRVAERVWSTETPKWRPDLSVAVASGTPKQRADAMAQGADVTTISRDNQGDLLAKGAPEFRTIIFDELSMYKGRGARWKQAKKIAKDAPYVWGLTGTPSPNGLMDLWAQMFLLDEGQALGKTITGYRSRFFLPGRQLPTGVVIEWRPREEAQDKIEELIAPTVLSMRAIDHLDNRPEVTINRIEVPLPAPVMKIYRQMIQDLTVSVGGFDYTAADGGSLVGRASQITAGMLYGDDHEGVKDPTAVLHHEKVRTALEVVEGTGSPVLIFRRFLWEQEALLEAIPGARTIDDQGALDDWDAGRVPALIAHPAAAGHGLNLQHGGHTILWTTPPPYDLELWQQGIARLARQGQTKPVMVHALVCPDTNDAKILDVLEGKADRQDALMSALGDWHLI